MDASPRDIAMPALIAALSPAINRVASFEKLEAA
jgi:hypothetical protein